MTWQNFKQMEQILMKPDMCFRRATSFDEGEGIPCHFLKLGKKCLDFGGKNTLIVSIYGLNFSFRMEF